MNATASKKKAYVRLKDCSMPPRVHLVSTTKETKSLWIRNDFILPFPGAPVFYSWPHFYGADPKLREGITGLNRNPNMNDTYANIHPKFGTMLGGKIKFQVNIQLMKSFGLSELNRYPDKLMLPMVWMDIVSIYQLLDQFLRKIQSLFLLKNLTTS